MSNSLNNLMLLGYLAGNIVCNLFSQIHIPFHWFVFTKSNGGRNSKLGSAAKKMWNISVALTKRSLLFIIYICSKNQKPLRPLHQPKRRRKNKVPLPRQKQKREVYHKEKDLLAFFKKLSGDATSSITKDSPGQFG